MLVLPIIVCTQIDSPATKPVSCRCILGKFVYPEAHLRFWWCLPTVFALGVVNDALATYRWTKQRASGPVFIWGHSLGTGYVLIPVLLVLFFNEPYCIRHIMLQRCAQLDSVLVFRSPQHIRKVDTQTLGRQ